MGESEEEKKYLIENLDKFEIIDLSNSNSIDLSNISDSIVIEATELLKDGIILNESSELFKCSAPLSKLMNFKYRTFGNAISGSNSLIQSQPNFTSILGSTDDLVGVTMQIASISLVQYFMFQVHEKLTVILKNVQEISEKLEYKEIDSLKNVVSELLEIRDKKNITEDDINNLIDLRKIIKDVLFYYKQNIMNKNEDAISFGKNNKFMKRIKNLIENIGEFDLDYYMYKASSEVLIYIDIFLYNFYIKTSNFQDAKLILEQMKNYNNLFEDDVKEKIKNLLNKIMDQFNYIYDHKDHLIDKATIAVRLITLPFSKVIPFVSSITCSLSNLGIKLVKTNKDAVNFLNEEIKKYDYMRYEFYHLNNEAVNLVKNFINEINKNRIIYNFSYNDKKYSFIEK